jgi:hypothetical protein
MANLVGRTFRATLASACPAPADRIIDAVGSSAQRDIGRALLLADRAARRWAASALAVERRVAENSLHLFPQLHDPESARALHSAALNERRVDVLSDALYDILSGHLVPHSSGSGLTVRCSCSVDRREGADEERKDPGGVDRLV